MAHGEPKSLNWGGGSGRFSEYTKGGRGGGGGGCFLAFFDLSRIPSLWEEFGGRAKRK